LKPAAISYKNKNEVNEHYLEDLDFMLKNGIYPGIATHDKNLVEGAYSLIARYNVPREKYEFQMLYGVTPNYDNRLLTKATDAGLCSVWQTMVWIFNRRLKENPRMASLIIKALFVRG
jgi:proline dehydrogenase